MCYTKVDRCPGLDHRIAVVQVSEKLIRFYFPDGERERAVAVAWKVSGMDPGMYDLNGSHGYGLFALHPFEAGLSGHQGSLLYSSVRNVAAAYRLWKQLGWERWPEPDPPDVPALPPVEGV
jgi:hypothetical protein